MGISLLTSLERASFPKQVSEKEGASSEESKASVDTAVADMLAHLAAGKLLEAADALEVGTKGTAAAASASDWARDARARALADQTVELLQAHACSLAATQS